MDNATINAIEHVSAPASKHGREVEFLRALITDFLSKDIGGPQSTSTDHAVGELDQEIAKLREEG